MAGAASVRVLLRIEAADDAGARPRDVVDAVLDRWGVARRELLSGARRRRVMLARRACIVALVRACPGLSLRDVGAEVGVSATKSVLHALRRAGVSR